MEHLELMPARIRIASILRKAILAGEFQEGQELSLTEMGNQLGVSRTPVREAFQTLASEGLIELRMNKGAIVRRIDEKFITDHYEMRILLEGEAAARAAANHMDPSLLRPYQEKALKALPVMTQEEYIDYNMKFHTTIWTAANNGKLYQFLMGLWDGPSVGKTTSNAEHREKSVLEHGKILGCIGFCEPEEARREMSRHIRRSMNNILDSFSESS
ncbi:MULTISPECIES: GntR family transcriptional regulator [Acutalibacteraceae]|uniref:GntR family transcriptional regulator n=1 Tax=Acutalibacteraceae TaxID=3082771 RepID=UPI001FAB266B|nr:MULTISPECIES: GntR family transcriptional regulator [Acutalibacteraceae]